MRTPLAVMALLAAVACTGCSDDPEPDFAPPESTSPAPTDPTTSASTPEPERLTPEETVRAWVEARNITVRTGDAAEVYALSTEACKSCANSVEPVRQVYKDGGRLETFGWRVRSVEQRPNFESSRQVAASVIFAAGRTFPTAEAEPISYEEEGHILLFTLARDSGSWKIDHFAYAS